MSAVVRGRAALDRLDRARASDLVEKKWDVTKLPQSEMQFVSGSEAMIRDLCDEIDARTECLESDLEMCRANRAHIALQFREMKAERDAALAAIERVRAMHPPFSLPDGTQLCDSCESKDSYPLDWPCPTIQAIGDQT